LLNSQLKRLIINFGGVLKATFRSFKRFEQKTTMKAIIISLFLMLQSLWLFGQTAMTCGGTLNLCGGTVLDPGGSGNYAADANCTQTICSSTAGQCVTLQFTSVNLENNYDFLRIYNGSSATGTPLATVTGTTSPGNVTSTSGCLTLVFTSDGSVQNSGWTANVICHACGSPPPPPPGPVIASDCSGAVNICTNASFQVDPSGSGSVDELEGSVSNPSTNPGSSNSGCLLSGELNSTWMIVNIASSGTLEFSIGADNGTGCLDWIMFPYNGSTTCSQILNNGISPIRCNWNGGCEGFTGLATPLPTGGDASNFEPELNVTCGQKYLICLSNYSSQSTSLPLNFFGTATISCSTFTPITVNSATICPGQSATLTASGGLTYNWSPATGLSATTGATVTATPATTTTYTVTGNGTCGSGTATSTVTVLAAGDPACSTPTCSATASNTGPYCPGATIQLNATGGGTYSWNGPNGFTSTVQNPSIPSATTAAAGVYTVTINVSGCTATASTTIVVNATPTVSAGNAVSICAGASTTLTASGAATYSWTPTTGLTSPAAASTAASPSANTTYTVTGTSAAGCTATSSVVITVNTAPTVTSSPVSICAGGSTPITANGASTYSWSPSAGLSAATGASVTFNGSANTTYTISGTSVGGCTATTTVLATVNALPTITGNNAAVCNSGSVQVTAGGANTYSWSPATNLSGTTGATVTFTAGTTTTYTVTGTNSNGCTNTHTITVSVSNGLTVGAGADQQECQGTQITLSGTGANTYSWTGGVSNGQPFTPGVGTTTYTVTGTDAAGCTGTDQVDVTINPNPTINGGIDQSFCAGQSTSLNASGGATYTWNNGVTNGATFTPNGTNTYTVTGTSAAGCTGTDQVLITVNPMPTVFAGNDVTVCTDETVTLTGSGADNYSWNNGISNGTAFTPNAGSTTYTVTGTTLAGCTGTDQVIVTVEASPSVAFAPDVTFGCAPLTVNFTNNSANGTSCVWQMGTASPLTGCGTVSNTFVAGGCYDVTLTVTSANGCVSTLTATDLICVEDQPIAAFSPSNSQLTELDAQVHFTNGSLNATSYIWNFGDSSPISTATDPDHDYEGVEIGTYVVTLIATSPSGCIDTAQSVIQIYEDLIFYIPNTFTPDNDDFNQTFQPVFTSGFDPEDYNLKIYNRWGELVFESNDAEIGWDGSYGSGGEISMVQEGVYTWKIEFKITRNDSRRMIVGHVNILK
jgi:gliding motility-associated-like protein